jgi:hypothetical protein
MIEDELYSFVFSCAKLASSAVIGSIMWVSY